MIHVHEWQRTDTEHEDDGILRFVCACGQRGWCGRNVYLAAPSPKTAAVRAYSDQRKGRRARETARSTGGYEANHARVAFGRRAVDDY